MSIALPALIAGVFGWDEEYGFCSWNTKNRKLTRVLLNQLLAQGIPTFIMVAYLLFAAVTVSISVFRSAFANRISSAPAYHLAQLPPKSESAKLSVALKTSKQVTATRSLTLRLIGTWTFACMDAINIARE